MARLMTSPRTLIAFAAVAFAVTACSGGTTESSPLAKRALVPPVELPAPAPATTTTTPTPRSPAESDQLARMEIRSVLAAAAEIYAETGSYNAEPATIAGLTADVDVVALEEAALYDAVAYVAFDQRLTLHRQSASGRWFCVDVTDEGADHGAGDTFEQALEDCTDDVLATGWGDVFSPTGSDEAAITAVVTATFEAFETGDTARIHELFGPSATCTARQLETVWPAGLSLIESQTLALEAVTVSGDTATASVSAGPLSDPVWPLAKHGSDWLNSADPCELLAPLATDRSNIAAGDTLERGLFAVRSLYVEQSSFNFSPGLLADIDADLVVVPPGEVSFGTVAYRGNPNEGVLITGAGSAMFFCAVESSSAITVYGAAATIDEVDTPSRCRAHATR
jgi:hypothetical protein